jgi:hypothetical protein
MQGYHVDSGEQRERYSALRSRVLDDSPRKHDFRAQIENHNVFKSVVF